jgi:hypothetical protein
MNTILEGVEFKFDREELADIVKKELEEDKSFRHMRDRVDRKLAELFGARFPVSLHNVWASVFGESITIDQIAKIMDDNKIPYRPEDFVRAKLMYCGGYFSFNPIYDKFVNNGRYRLHYTADN